MDFTRYRNRTTFCGYKRHDYICSPFALFVKLLIDTYIVYMFCLTFPESELPTKRFPYIIFLPAIVLILISIWFQYYVCYYNSLEYHHLYLSFHPVKMWLQRLFDRMFFRIKYNFEIALQHSTHTLNKELTSENLIASLLQNLQHYLQVKGVVLVLQQQNTENRIWKRGIMPNITDKEISTLLKFTNTSKSIAAKTLVEQSKSIHIIDEIELGCGSTFFFEIPTFQSNL